MIKTEIRSRSEIKGHPLHPALIHFPVALLLLVIATDITYIVTERAFWSEASYWLIVVGLGFGILSSIPGAIDVISVHKIRHIVAAWAHALLAVMTLSITTFNLLLRLGPDPGAMIVPWGIYVSGLAGIFIYLTGSLGAQLVFEYGVGIDVPLESEREVEP